MEHTTSGSGSTGLYAWRRYLMTGTDSSTNLAASIPRNAQAAVLASKLFPFNHGLRHSAPDTCRGQKRVEPGVADNFT